MPQISIENDGHVRIVTIANPPRGYMNAATAKELVGVLKDADADDSVRALVFTGGIPGVFIRHYDVAEIVALAEALRAGKVDQSAPRDASPVYDLFDRLLAYCKPTIAAINGVAMGGGFEFALACDIRITEPGDFPIGLPETNLGIIPGVGGLQMLSRVVGTARATEMVMLGRTIGPEEAAKLGIVSACDPRGALVRAAAVAHEIAGRSPVAIAEVKRMVHRIHGGETLAAGMVSAAASFTATLVQSGESLAAMRAFLAGGEDINAR